MKTEIFPFDMYVSGESAEERDPPGEEHHKTGDGEYTRNDQKQSAHLSHRFQMERARNLLFRR